MMRTDATSLLGYAANTSVSGFKGWISQRWQLSSNIKLKWKTEQGCSEWRWCIKANLSTKASNETRNSTSCSRLTPLSPKEKKKTSSCNLLLLNSHQDEIVVFCQITLNKLCKGLEHSLPSKLLHSCFKGPTKWYNFLPLNYSSVFPPRKAIN